MTDREKLIELIATAKRSMWGKNGLSCELARNSYIAEFLLSHGVTFEKQGEWIAVSDDDQYEGMFYCSLCKDERWFGEEVYTSTEAERLCHYCPNCGARMKGENNEEKDF